MPYSIIHKSNMAALSSFCNNVDIDRHSL